MKLEFTKKIYYKKFDHRVVILTRSYRASKYSDFKIPTSECLEWLMATKFDRAEWKGLTSYSYVHNQQSYTIYFKDTKVLDFLKSQLGEDGIEVLERPIDEEHSRMLTDNDKLVTRKSLFYGKYRMVLRVAPERLSQWQTSTKNIQEMRGWCHKQFGLDDSKYSINGYSRGNFYFAEVKDALLFKLTWGGEDVKTERVITVAEVEAMSGQKG
jgi:hypothetical protein